MSEWLDASLVADVRKTLLDNPGPVTTSAVAEAVQRTGRVLGSSALLELVTRLSAQLSGAGPLQSVLEVPGTTDVFVNGPREIFADTGDGPRLLDLTLGSEEDVRSLAVRLAALGGRRLDDSSPYVDVRLPDGVRMNAIVPPISGETTTISFRVPKRAGLLELVLELLGDRGQILLTFGSSVCDETHDFVIDLGMEDLEGQVFEFPFDRVHAQPVCQRGEDVEGLAGFLRA